MRGRDKRAVGHSVTKASLFHDRRPGEVMRVDSLLKSDRVRLVFEGVGDDKVRVTCQSERDAKAIPPEEALQVVALGKILHVCRVDRPAEFLNVELYGLAETGYGPRHL